MARGKRDVRRLGGTGKPMADTVPGLVATIASRSPDAAAVLAPGRATLTYAGLHAQMEECVAAMRAAGVTRTDRVALVVPDGAEAATAFLGVAAGAVCAPLNPRYQEKELEFYLGDLGAAALVTPAGVATPAREVAARRGIQVLDLDPSGAEAAGRFRLSVPARVAAAGPGRAAPGDVALVLHTSGTTSRPKLVPLTHANLVASAAAIARTLALTAADRSLCVMPLFHIHGLVGVLLSSLTAGSSVFCTEGFLAPRFLAWLGESAATWYSAVPTMHQAVLARVGAGADGVDGHRLRFIRSSSSSLPPPVMASLERVFGVPVVEAYGMTEASHQMASNPLPPGVRKPGSVGLPAGPEIAVMGADGALLPAGQRGEVVIRGASVTRGYEANPEANAKAFADGWFRTGDEGAFDADGYLFLSGRLKELINRGGEKIAPREVDEVLLAHPAVAQAVTFGAPHPTLGEEVAAAVVMSRDSTVGVEELQAFVAARLADFKVPRRIVVLGEVPKGPTGKVQRIGLAERLGVSFDSPRSAATAGPAPGAGSQSDLAAIWREVLGVGRVDPDDDFFSLGGDSILATRVRARVVERLGVELPLTAFFGDARLGSMARRIDESRAAAAQTQVARVIPRLPRDGPLPLSFTQERMWFLEQLEPQAALFNRPVAIRLRGPLQVTTVGAALDAVVARHEILRASIGTVDGSPELALAPRIEVPLAETDLRAEPGRTRERALLAALRDEARKPFDLARGPLVRAHHYRLGDGEAVLLLVFHHVVFDGASVGVLLRELAAHLDAALAGAVPELPPLGIQYVDWSAWHRAEVERREAAGDLEYWTRQLAGAPHVLELPADHARPATRTYRGAQHTTHVARAVADRLVTLAHEHGTSLFTVLLAALAALLERLTGQEDILLGCPVSGRTRVEVEPLIGSFINTLVLRVSLAGDPTFAELVDRCRLTVEGALAHQDVPFERLVEALQPARDRTRNPLYQVLLQLRNLHEPEPGGRHVTVEEVRFDRGVAGVDVELDVRQLPDGLECVFGFAEELFEPATRTRFAARFATLLEAACERPGTPIAALPVLGEEERGLMLDSWQGARATVLETRCVHDLVAERAAARPSAPAVEGERERCDYAALEAGANRLAHLLVAQGVGRDVRVGIALPRSLRMVEAVLAVLKAGGCYVPLDPEMPAARIEFVRRDAGVGLVLTTAELAARVSPLADGAVALDREGGRLAGLPAVAPRVEVAPDQLAYVIYTSGSTGAPKGVMIEHGGVAGFVRACSDAYAMSADDRVLQFASLTFDTSTAEIFLALANGATLVLRPEGPAAASAAFLRWLGEKAVTVACLPTAYWHQLTADMVALGLAPPRALRFLHVGGEVVQAEALARWHRCAVGDVHVVNSYGPTETSVMCTLADLGPNEAVRRVLPIGRPYANSRAYVLDGRGQLAPVGVPGELYIGGTGVGRGYLGRPDLTAERYLPDPFSARDGARMYRTGDRARWRWDGQLEFLGRLDFQVKIRGQRVEPGEIEAVLLGHPSVAQAVVTSGPDRDGESTLVAYVVPAPGRALAIELIREHVARLLPSYMVPERFLALSALPVNHAGKVDRAALPEPDPDAAPGVRVRGPSTAMEATIAGIWAAVLGRSGFGAEDDFFAVGGHSLRAIRVAAALRERFGLDVPISLLFEARTVAALAESVETLLWMRDAGSDGRTAAPAGDGA